MSACRLLAMEKRQPVVGVRVFFLEPNFWGTSWVVIVTSFCAKLWREVCHLWSFQVEITPETQVSDADRNLSLLEPKVICYFLYDALCLCGTQQKVGESSNRFQQLHLGNLHVRVDVCFTWILSICSNKFWLE